MPDVQDVVDVDNPSLELLRARAAIARDTVRLEIARGIFVPYLLQRRSDGGTVVGRVRRSQEAHRLDGVTDDLDGGNEGESAAFDATDHATSTAFTLARILSSGGGDPAGLLGVDEETFRRLVDTFLGDFKTLYASNVALEERILPVQEVSDDGPKLATSKFPNPYNSAIHLSALAGLVAAEREVEDTTLAAADSLAAAIANWFLSKGRIANLDVDEQEDVGGEAAEAAAAYIQGRSNAYLTFLCVDALRAWGDAIWRRGVQAGPSSRDKQADTGKEGRGGITQLTLANTIDSALIVAHTTSVADLSRQVASQSINRESLFDAMDIVCTLAAANLSGKTRTLDLIDEYFRGLVREALRCLGEDYLVKDGSFAPKGGAFTNENKYSIVLSSAEIGDILFSAVHDMTVAELNSFDRLIGAVIRRREGRRGWGHAAPDAYARHVFAAASSLALLRRYESAVTSVLAHSAAQLLSVPAMRHQSDLAALDVGPVWETLAQHTITPLKQGRWDRADLSLVLHGPPGTAKTTIARKIAQDLGWPLLELDQGAFLTRGAAELEAEAERIFALVQDLRNTVVLFDEIEGMVGGRGLGSSESSRFLTTSMLPRLHHLRDHAQVVFIIATNYKEKLDSAATRPGRIDRILSVELPEKEQCRGMLESLIARHDPDGKFRIREMLDQPGSRPLDKGPWTFKYYELLVRRCATHRALAGKETELSSDCIEFAVHEVEDLHRRFAEEMAAWDEGRRSG